MNIDELFPNWNQRHTVKRFDEDAIINTDYVEIIKQTLSNTPMQSGQHVTHFWLVLTPDDRNIKKFLVRNMYKNSNIEPEISEGKCRHMIQVLTAPYVFLACMQSAVELNERYFIDNRIIDSNWKIKGSHIDDIGGWRNMGIDIGAMLIVCNKLGLDTAVIGCHEFDENEHMEEWQRLIKERFDLDINVPPTISFNFGKAIHSDIGQDIYVDEDGYEYSYNTVPNPKKWKETPTYQIHV